MLHVSFYDEDGKVLAERHGVGAVEFRTEGTEDTLLLDGYVAAALHHDRDGYSRWYVVGYSIVFNSDTLARTIRVEATG